MSVGLLTFLRMAGWGIFANAMKPYLENEDQTHKVALYNAQYAKEHFMASSVAQQLESNIFLHLRHFG